MKTIDLSAAPKHLQGEMVKAWTKAVYASSRMHHGRGRRIVAVVKASGEKVRRNRWDTTHSRWQKRFAKAMAALRPYEQQVVELEP